MDKLESPTPIDFPALENLQKKPPLYDPGIPRFWDDEHISKKMLEAHLSPLTEAASRGLATIEKTVDFIIKQAELKAGDSLLDLGCGPGLYAARFAGQGIRVTGMDFSRRSLIYAKEQARAKDLDIEYVYGDITGVPFGSGYDAIVQIYGEVAALPPDKRKILFNKVHRALNPGGLFIFDVQTSRYRKHYSLSNNWYTAEDGFWRAGRHLVLERGFDYPEEEVFLNQYIVIDSVGGCAVYRNWFQDYTPERITGELKSAGFKVKNLFSDLTGRPYTEDSEWIAVINDKI